MANNIRCFEQSRLGSLSFQVNEKDSRVNQGGPVPSVHSGVHAGQLSGQGVPGVGGQRAPGC